MSKVEPCEVGPRCGLQNETDILTTDVKARWIEKLRTLLLLTLAIVVSNSGPANANDRWRIFFNIDNDVLVGEDRHYTNGLFLEVIAPKDRVPGWMRRAAVVLSPFDPPASDGDEDAETDVRWGIALGHEMYTPENSSLRVLNPVDRPYAGYFFARFELARDRYRDHPAAIPFLDLLQVDAGVVGPAALARHGQRVIHEITFSPIFRGWDNQLKNEPALTLRRSRHWRLPGDPITLNGGGIEMDAVAGLTAELGNVKTAATGGITLRAGWRLPADFGRGRYVPSEVGGEGFRLYAFAGFEVSGVAHNIFLDGNTFRDSHSVSKHASVLRAPAGLGFQHGRFRTMATVVWTSKEFEGQDGADVYGSFSLVLDY